MTQLSLLAVVCLVALDMTQYSRRLAWILHFFSLQILHVKLG